MAQQRAILCPRCRRLIGSNEDTCSWCGTSRSAPWWQMLTWSRGALGGEGVLKAIVTANLVYYALSLLLSPKSGGLLAALAPGRSGLMLLGATGTIPIDQFGRFWTVISANYLHAGLLHIIFNLMALRQIAPWTVHEYGASRMFVIYTLGGAFGFWVSYLAGVPFTIGASAAVCSLIGALLYFGKSRGGVYGTSVYREVSGWVFSLIIIGMIMPGINNWGHGGGVVGGIILGKLLGYDERRPNSPFHTLLAALCAAVTVGVLGWAVWDAVAILRGVS